MSGINCMDCNGTGICYGVHGGVNCHRCDGTGVVSREMINWIDRGINLRKLRMSNGYSMLDAARNLNVQSARISAVESGRVYNLDVDYLVDDWGRDERD